MKPSAGALVVFLFLLQVVHTNRDARVYNPVGAKKPICVTSFVLPGWTRDKIKDSLDKIRLGKVEAGESNAR